MDEDGVIRHYDGPFEEPEEEGEIDLETRAVPAVDTEEGDECPVCLETLKLNNPMQLLCKHLICKQCLQQLHMHGANQLRLPSLSSKTALWL